MYFYMITKFDTMIFHTKMKCIECNKRTLHRRRKVCASTFSNRCICIVLSCKCYNFEASEIVLWRHKR